MELCCLFSPNIATPDMCAVAEQLGYTRSWVTDSPTFMADPWITLGRAADRTSSIRLGICALTPRMRHLVATAGAAATLDAVAPGRVDLVIGTGFTSQAMIDQPPARWSEAEAYVRGLRDLLAGAETEWDGKIVALPYGRLSGIKLPADVSLWVAAHGPKGRAVGQRVADGIVTNPGHGPSNEVWADERVFVQINGTILDEGEPLDSPRVLEAAGPAAALHLHIGADGVAGETAEVSGFHAALAAVDPKRRHIETHRGHLTELTEIERPWVTPELIKAATETGTAEEMESRLHELAASGVAGVIYFPAGPDLQRELECFAQAARSAVG
jgi:5,10-methylenetetrahydromethanopterin reductase